MEEIHVDDEKDAFRVKYKKLGRLNRITVIADDDDETYGICDNKKKNGRQGLDNWIEKQRILRQLNKIFARIS